MGIRITFYFLMLVRFSCSLCVVNVSMELNLLWLQGWGTRGNAPSVQTTVPPSPFPISATLVQKLHKLQDTLNCCLALPTRTSCLQACVTGTSLHFPTWLYVLLKTQRAPSQHLTEYDQTMFYQKWIIPLENW